MKASFIVNIPIKDRDGRVIGQEQVVKYEGLLARAHEDGLRSVHTELVQIPTKANGDVAIVRAVVVTCRGTFEGIGDASPSNVNARVANALIRVSETRAKARAMRDACNAGMIALDPGYYLRAHWLHGKLALVAGLIAATLYAGRAVKRAAAGLPLATERHYRVMNEVPTLLMIGIVLLVILKPF